MNCYRITKYNPTFRDKNGNYTANDWTSISDIGKTFIGGVLSQTKYKQTEDSYVDAVKIILKEKGISKMMLCSLEKNDDMAEFVFSAKEKDLFNRIDDNFCVELNELETAVRLALREVIWCNLLSDTGDLKIEFGYDYYMYIRCNEMEEAAKQIILNSGLFVEEVIQEDTPLD
ncbi:MAG: hypothetical protein IJE62_06735 [Clostridia bacterium]|nr:hypothetical protein [Clostridia bacterium]